MTLCIRASKALATTTTTLSQSLKVRFLFPFSYSLLHTCPASPSEPTATHYKQLIFNTIEKKPWAFCNAKWVSNQFHAVIVDPHLFIQVLNLIREKPRIALRFFRWVDMQPGVRRSELAFSVMLDILVENNLMRSAYWVMERVIITFRMHGIVDVLICGYLNLEVSVKLLDLCLLVCYKNLMVDQCFWIFSKMLRNELLPDVKNCNRILSILRKDKSLVAKFMQVYRLMQEFGINPSVVTYNTMLDFLCKEGEWQQAIELSSEMETRHCFPSDVTFNVLINGLTKNCKLEEAKERIWRMLELGLKVSAYTYNPLICGYLKKGLPAEALSLREEMVEKGAACTVATYNTLMYGLCRWGRVNDAIQLFVDMLKRGMIPDVISYNTLIYGYCRVGNISEAFRLFDELRFQNLVPTVVTYNTLIDGVCRLGNLDLARRLKDTMISQGIFPDVVTYTILVTRCCKLGNLSAANEFFNEMLHKGLEPDRFAHTTHMVGNLKFGDPARALSLQRKW
ncbi:hypothetical protein PTKIN_Ptkin04bG0007500 [Pterospermum kingtungense]